MELRYQSGWRQLCGVSIPSGVDADLLMFVISGAEWGYNGAARWQRGHLSIVEGRMAFNHKPDTSRFARSQTTKISDLHRPSRTSASLKRCKTAVSPAKKAMTTLVSRRTLPGIRLDLFAAFLDCLRHGFEVRRIDGADETGQFPSGRSSGRGQAPRKIQHLLALVIVQAVNLLDDLIFDG